MEIIKAFQNNELNIPISILGSYEEPLMRASDIGTVLGVVNIHTTIKDLDNTEKVIHSMDTLGGKQDVTFLTEKGLYQVLFTSRKPIAKQFKNWVCDVIKEIRLTGKYELEKQLETQKKQLKEKDLQREKVILDNFEGKSIVYLGYADKEKNIGKVGYTDFVESRLNRHKDTYNEEFTYEYVYESTYNREIERRILTHQEVTQMKLQKKYSGKNRVELIQFNDIFTIEYMNSIILDIKKEVESNQKNRDHISEISRLKLEVDELKKNKKNDEITSVKVINDKNIKYDMLKNMPESKIYDESVDNEHFYVVRNIKTKDEKLFSCVNKVGQFLNFEPKSVLRFVDFQKLIYGHHVRSFGKNYWQPCENFVYNTKSKPSFLGKYTKSVNIDTGEIRIYESLTEASNFLGGDETFRRRVNKYVDKNKIFIHEENKLIWTSIPVYSCGTYIKCPNKFDLLDNKPIKELIPKGPKREIPIIARNIETGEITKFKTINETKRFLDYDMTKSIGIPKQIKGFTFSLESQRYWSPPKNFKFLKDHICQKKCAFVRTTDVNTKEITYYNSMLEMAVFTELCKIDDEPLKRDNSRELIRNLAVGSTKISKNEILNELKIESLESCGYWIYPDGRIENIY